MSMPTYRLYIDGAWQDSDGSEELKVLNPATEEVIGLVPQATRTDVVRAVEAARRAFDRGPWPTMSVKERSRVLLRMAEVMDRRRNEIIELNMREAGSVRWLAESIQAGIPIDHFRDMAERAMLGFAWERPMMPTIVPGAGIGQGVIRREPFGVAALISAYNFPFFLNTMKLAPALAAGCTVVLKPAPTTPLEAFLFAEIAEEAGLPPGVLNVVTGDVEAGRELTTHPMVDLISFTGSDVVGRHVYTQAAPSLKKVVLELGGKSANIICADADLRRAVVDVIMGITMHAGQGCALLTRTLVHESRKDELIQMVTAALDGIRVGDPFDPKTGMGPLISAAQREKVESLIRTGAEEGARLAYGGGRPVGLDKGFFVEPTLFVDVDNSMTIARKEFFGPVGVVIPFQDDDEAVRIANDSDFGLSGGVWAKDPVHAYEIAKRIRTGTVAVNGGGGAVTPHAAFGGYKQSGLGREWGEAGLDEYLQTKTITWSAMQG
ncbi:aldehyde dehydrogenase family protein [Streptomyces sp. GQFP]|uniref:aldehyde dehydrogenase family protein n=1 Tax=Streptomyces sp. GQFP TaxID=2907545 RepID=UPI001F463805|nr:aldehyde dehydrogenase family protein [Streptomyces sp. GQFP]UIX29307.1 aldehyde dehydrogenase family protein [Streptomyces sp. GQFP]